MVSFKQFLAEDIINVLTNIEDNIKSGNISEVPQSHISTLAALRVYVHSNNEDDKATVGIRTLTGSEISDSQAIVALSKYVSGSSDRAKRLNRNELHSMSRIMKDGQRNNFKDVLDVVGYLKSKLKSM